MNTLENNIRTLCNAQGISLTELGKKAGIAHSTLFHVMRRGNGQQRIIQKLAVALGVTPERLLGTHIKIETDSFNLTDYDKDRYIAFLEKEVEFLKGLLSDQMSYLKLAADSQPEAVIIPMNRAADYQPAKAV
ncbi:helix-turn-helix domain-containing protein [Rhodoflexus caldus]|uniref:helix-turn-helix domain-containing protein n=1 Tax=Rhodoflexus caldus TaxID=2891236 RepID=UPI00202A8040|nr:helix-turn-helix transcriptional regulator [Rhodoflexus caldus]